MPAHAIDFVARSESASFKNDPKRGSILRVRCSAVDALGASCLASRKHTDQKSQTQCDGDNNERIPLNGFLGIVESFCRS